MSVSVLITHHKPELTPYLMDALVSLSKQEGVEFKGHLISSCALDKQVLDFIASQEGRIVSYEMAELNSPSKKTNYWLDNLVGDATHTMILSNDVILSKNCLASMSLMQSECIQTPMSNNEMYYRFFADIPWTRPSYDHEEINAEQVHNFTPNIPVMIRHAWVSFYAPFMQKSVWDKVGRLEPVFDKKYNDMDFCYRARQAGIPTAINLACFALHYGSKTTNTYMNSEDELAADKAFNVKYSLADLANFLM